MDKALKAIAIYLAWMLATMPVFPQRILAPILQPAPTSSCTAPTLANQWEMWNASNTCNGGSACTNGAGLDTVVDSAGSITLTQTTSADRPIYTTSAVNGLASGTWNTANMQLAFSSLLPQNTTDTWFAVVNQSSLVTANVILGNDAGGTGVFEWRFDSSGHQQLLKGRVAVIGTSTSTYSINHWYAIMVTYNQPTGDWVFYNCSAGSCVADGSGTNAQTFSNGLDRIGFYGSDGVFVGQIAEVNYAIAITTTGYGAYAQCKYGI